MKKPICAYSLFVKERRQMIQLANPNLDHVEVMQLLSDEWQEIDKNVLQSYKRKAEQDKKRYD